MGGSDREINIYENATMIRDTSDLVRHLSKQSALSEEQATEAIQLLLDWVMSTLSEGNEVRLFGFGSFLIHELEPKECLDPRTGEKITLPATKRPILKSSKELRKMLNPEKHIKPPTNPVDLLVD